MQWNAATQDWHTTRGTNDLRIGGKFTSRMDAKDGGVGFDFEGTYTNIIEFELIEHALGDQRTVSVVFKLKTLVGRVRVCVFRVSGKAKMPLVLRKLSLQGQFVTSADNMLSETPTTP